MVAVCAVEADGGGELGELRDVEGDVVGGGRVVDAVWVLGVEGRVVHSREDFVESVVVEEGFDFGGVDVVEAVFVGG